MEESQTPYRPNSVTTSASSHNIVRHNADGHAINLFQGPGFPGRKKRGHGSRSWIEIDQNGNSKNLELDKAALMRYCSLPARDLRLLDPLFIYPSTILGREKAIVVNLEEIRCIITADEVILMNSLDGCVVQYKSELCKRLQSNKDQADDLPFELRALELALELTCMSLDAQVKELDNGEKGSSRLNIAIIHPNLGIGGAERLIVDAAAELASHRHKVHIFTAHHDKNRCFEETLTSALPVTVYVADQDPTHQISQQSGQRTGHLAIHYLVKMHNQDLWKTLHFMLDYLLLRIMAAS